MATDMFIRRCSLVTYSNIFPRPGSLRKIFNQAVVRPNRLDLSDPKEEEVEGDEEDIHRVLTGRSSGVPLISIGCCVRMLEIR